MPASSNGTDGIGHKVGNYGAARFYAGTLRLLLLLLLLSLLLIALVICSAFTRRMSDSLEVQVSRLNGFELEGALIPVDHILSGGVSRDGIPALTMPAVIDAEELAEINFELERNGHGPFLSPGQRVIGVTVNGESRAYGINLLTWHEIVNDVIGGVPLAIVYCPLCDSATVFDRRVGDEVLEFGVSGLLYNSNILMYNRSEDREHESLWSQLQARAVTGVHAEAGAQLSILPAVLIDWGSWLAGHPDGGLAWRDRDNRRDLDMSPYEEYFREGKLRFPAWPILPDDSPLHAMDRIIAVDNGDGWIVFPVRQLRLELSGDSSLAIDDVVFSLTSGEDGAEQHVSVLPAADRSVRIAYAFWFSWYAMHPDSELFPVLE